MGIAAEKVLRGYFWIDVDGQIMLGRGLQSYPPFWHAPSGTLPLARSPPRDDVRTD